MEPVPLPAARAVTIALTVNGESRQVEVEARTTLLDALRDRLHLTGTKKGCALGQCGACTVLLDGRRINSCLTLAVMQQGRAITTIEGLGERQPCIRCRRRSSSMTASSAATARPADHVRGRPARPKGARARTTRSAST